jgi:hypothetical protein
VYIYHIFLIWDIWAVPKVRNCEQWCSKHGVKVALLYPGLYSFGYIPRSGTTELNDSSIFWGTSIPLSIMSILIYILINCWEGFLLLFWLEWGEVFMLFWFAFPVWTRTSSISSCVYQPFVFLLRIVCSAHLTIHSMGH